MSGAFKVTGDERLAATMHAAGDQLADLRAVNNRVGDLVAGAARPRVPIRSGRLASSLHPVAVADKVTITSSAPYAGPIHWGWPARHIVGRPFLSDAATSTEDVWVGMYFDEVQAAVNKVDGA